MAAPATAGTALDEARPLRGDGDALPRWATPWAEALEAPGPDLWTQSQVRGWAGVGAGGSASLAAGAKVDGSAAVTGKVLVEIPTTPEQHRQLSKAAR